jgi:putative DNA primase/helicase
LKRLQMQREYTLPKSHGLRINQVVRANNSVAAFLQSHDKVRPTHNPEDKADVRNIFDYYVMYMKDIARGWNVTYERFIQMLEELGHKVEVYNGADGALRHQAIGIKMLGFILPPDYGQMNKR